MGPAAAAAAAAAAISLPAASLHSPPPLRPPLLAISSSLRRLSISAVYPSSALRSTNSAAVIARAAAEGGEESTSTDADSDATAAAVSVAVADEVAEDPTSSNAEAEEEGEEKPPRKPIVKLGDIMGILNQRAIEEAEKVKPVPDLRSGDIIELKLQVPQKRRRFSIFKGIVMSKQNAGVHTTIRVRRIIAGIGVEIVFPVYSPLVKEIKVVKHRKVRRARLYYLRDKLPRFSTFK